MSMATLNGHSASAARVQLPAFGAWWADLTLQAEVELEGAVEIKLADLTLSGAIVSGGPFRGASRYRVAAGAAGWGKTIPGKSYANDLGVKLSTVLGDAALAAGETLDASTVPASTVGPAYTRERGPAGRVLQRLAPEAWFVAEDGATRLGRRARVVYDGQATRQNVDLARGVLELASDEIAALLPGVVIDGVEAVDVVHELKERTLRTVVWGRGATATSRRLSALRALLAQLLPDYRYRGVYEYRVVSQGGERLDLQPVRSVLGLPDLQRVRVRPGVAGCRADVTLGSTVLVAFVDADPGRPAVVGFEDAEGDGFAPSRLDLVGEDDPNVLPGALGANGRVVRYGDPIVFASPGPGVVEIPVPAPLSRVRA
jgi:hypothetical protein